MVRYAGAAKPEGVGILLGLKYNAGRANDPPESSRPKRCHWAESGTITSSIKRSVTLVSPLSLGRGPRFASVSIFHGHSGGSIHSTMSRLAWPLPMIFPSLSTLYPPLTAIILAESGKSVPG